MHVILAALAFLGRHGTRTFALSLVLGFALPQLASTARPLIGPIIFTFVAVNIMRADLPAIRRVLAAPHYVALAVAANVLAPFLLTGAAVLLIGREAIDPGLLLGLSLAAAAPPLVAAPAYAILLGFSNAMPLTVLVIGMALSPLVAPFVADAIAGTAVPIDRLALALRLVWFLGAAGAVGLAVRWLAGDGFIARRRSELDGVGVVLFFVFAVALTDGIGSAFREDPVRVLWYTLLAFGTCGASFAVTLAIWARFHREDGLTLALATGLRNMGLLVAVMGVDTVPAATFLFFALNQFPVYFAPQLLTPVARRFAVRPPGAGVAPPGFG